MKQIVYSLANNIEKKITNGLGYSQIDHHTDDDKGLIRHLFDMEGGSKIYPLIYKSLILGEKLAIVSEKREYTLKKFLEIIDIIINNSSKDTPSRISFPTSCLEDISKKLKESSDSLYSIQSI